jgi:hypothetical protein
VAAVQLVGAVGRDDQDALAAQAAPQEGEEPAGRAIGPVQVLDRQQDRGLLAEAIEEPQERLEEAALGRRVRGPVDGPGRTELREQRRQLALDAGREIVEHGVARTGQ